MRSKSVRTLLCAAMLSVAWPLCAQPLAAGEMVASPNPDADALANDMRVLATSPNNLTALVHAGEVALKLGDPVAAQHFFARAERVDPRNPRVKAGTAATLVHLERPGEALRRFGEAEALGYDPRDFAGERGLAYDLIGQQERAQRDYRQALTRGSDDEILRRYALSLGISGKRDEALAQIDPLLRKSDRAAWRSRAFILAMNGDTAEADHIATSMLPPGIAQGLKPFFRVLPTLAPTERAFAVHFGEIHETPERIADARLAPSLPPLGNDPSLPVRVAAVPATMPVAAVAVTDGGKGGRKHSHVAPPVQVATTARPVAAVAALPPPPREEMDDGDIAATQPATAPAPERVQPAPVRQTVSVKPAPVATAAPSPKPAEMRPTAELAAATPLPAPQRESARQSAAAPSLAGPVKADPVASAPRPVASKAGAARSVPLRTAPVRSEESILAKIVAEIKVPDEERNAGSPAPTAAASRRGKAALTAEEGARGGASADRLAQNSARDRLKGESKHADRGSDKDSDKSDEKKSSRDKKSAKDKKPDGKAAEPARYWVQVSGGARKGDLPKAWAQVRDKTPALKGRQAYATPLRATNRVLTGPFKSAGEAQAFVNKLAGQGVAAFVFTSDAGQKVDRLADK